MRRELIQNGMPSYTVKVVNNSESTWKFFVYQPPPAGHISELTLAWIASPYRVVPEDKTFFKWETNYQLVWSPTGELLPGVTFIANGQKDCDPNGANESTFTFQNDTPTLSDAVSGGVKGTLYIHSGPGIPSNTFAVGIGMSGKGTFVVNARPNVTEVFTPTLAYYIAAINEVQEGEVMDVTTISQSAEIKFPTNVHTLTATLNPNNTWSITQQLVSRI